MKRAWIALAAVALFAAVPAAATAKHTRPAVKNAAKYCKAQRSQLGAAAFRATYGGKKNAFGKCVKKRVHDLNALRRTAVQQCKQELAAQGSRWRNDTQAGNGNGDGRGATSPGRAFKKCVNDKTQQQDQDNQDAVINAVRSCLTEHDADPAAFNAKYGVDGSAREAFGHCVREQLSQNSGDGEGDSGDGSGDTSAPGDSTGADAPTGDTPLT
jgi:hypothetical protein